MQVKLNKEEIIQACVEWAARHHGLAISGDTKIRVELETARGVHVATDLAIEFAEARGSGGPYREPG